MSGCCAELSADLGIVCLLNSRALVVVVSKFGGVRLSPERGKAEEVTKMKRGGGRQVGKVYEHTFPPL